MARLRRKPHRTTEGDDSSLKAEAHSQCRNLGSQLPNELDRSASCLWPAGTGRDDESIGLQQSSFIDAQSVVAVDDRRRAQLAGDDLYEAGRKLDRPVSEVAQTIASLTEEGLLI